MWFKLFASCVLVEGKSNSLIYDTDRSAIYDFPNDFVEILKMSRIKDISEIKKLYHHMRGDMVENFFNQFIEAEIGFYTDDPQAFPDIDFTWESPYRVSNAIIELDKISEFNFDEVVIQLSSLGCRAVQLRLLCIFSDEKLENFIKEFNDSRVNHVELLIPHHENINYQVLYKMLIAEPRLNRIMIYGSPDDKIINHEDEQLNKTIIHFKKDITKDSKEIIKIDRFTTNIEAFSEAQNHNIGLNRKVCIDKRGEIKNFLSHAKSFGNIKTVKIKDIIEKDDFKEKWGISNNKIEICMDCQYRYCCVSNSDIKKEGAKYFKVDMCAFNPSSNTWNEN